MAGESKAGRSENLRVYSSFALVLIKLNLESRLRIRNPLDGGQRDLELKIAKSADADRRDGSEPFEHPKSPLFHF